MVTDAGPERPGLLFHSLAALEPLMDKCVHCGFCLPTCPSYLLLGQEMDSPRGRIYLMRAGVEGRVGVGDAFRQHFDTCLGCMACETACPSGVRYAPLVEETRATIERHHRRDVFDRMFRRMLFAVLPYPRRLRLLSAPLGLARALRRRPGALARLPLRIRNLIQLAPDAARPAAVPAFTPAADRARLRAGLVTGCVQRVFFGTVNQATARALAAEGCDVHAPADQGCCGALALHAGRDEEARAFARALIAAFERSRSPQTAHDRERSVSAAGSVADGTLDAIVVNAAGCGSTMKSYGELLKADPAWAPRARAFAAKVRDVSETLAALTPARAARRRLDLRVAYHDACHLAHAQGIRREPRALLESIPGITIVPLAEPDICCGSAGIFNLVEPEMAAALGARKAAHVADAAPDVVVTSNPGCILQLRTALRAAGRDTPVMHVVELFDRATIRQSG